MDQASNDFVVLAANGMILLISGSYAPRGAHRWINHTIAGRPLASARRPPREGKSRAASRNARFALKSSVAVAAERGARRGHRGCACSPGERRDRDQRDQRERGDEFPHDTSPHYGTLSSVLQQRHGPLPCLAVTVKIRL